MFVNDTCGLPDSGRVCVMGFGSGQNGTRTYYSLLVNAARAEIEPMTEPRHPGQVLGVGTHIESVKGPVFAAYFAATRERFDAQPNYKNALFVLVDGAVYAVKAEHIDTQIRRGLRMREFTLLRGDRPQRSVQYRWPWYREPFVSGSGGGARSGDFMREISTMVREYG